jgi:cardiolipin synthase
MNGRTAQGVTAWALALLFLPYIAVPLYMILGERRFLGYVRGRRKGLRMLDKSLQECLAAIQPYSVTDHEPWLRGLVRLGKLPLTSSNRVKLLIDGDAMFAELFQQIDSAQRYIMVEFYIYRDDDTGRELQRRLLSARERGVEVYFMYDEFGCMSLPNEYIDRLSRAGCRCTGFRTQSRRRRRFLRLNFRNHRKIAVVDGRLGLVGGINVGDEYRGRDEQIGPWRDSHAVLEGPSVQCLQMVFLEDWYWAQRNVPDKLEWKPEPAGDRDVLVYPSGPADELETGSLLFGQLIDCAKERLWIATPYFVPDEFVLNSLHLASLRGVDVRVLTPRKGDSVLTTLAGRSYFREMIGSGVQIWVYSAGFLHQKVVVSDNTAAIGTANLDNRSMRINFEVTAVVPDPAFAAATVEMLERDFSRATRVSKEQLAAEKFPARFACRLARAVSPIL